MSDLKSLNAILETGQNLSFIYSGLQVNLPTAQTAEFNVSLKRFSPENSATELFNLSVNHRTLNDMQPGQGPVNPAPTNFPMTLRIDGPGFFVLKNQMNPAALYLSKGGLAQIERMSGTVRMHEFVMQGWNLQMPGGMPMPPMMPPMPFDEPSLQFINLNMMPQMMQTTRMTFDGTLDGSTVSNGLTSVVVGNNPGDLENFLQGLPFPVRMEISVDTMPPMPFMINPGDTLQTVAQNMSNMLPGMLEVHEQNGQLVVKGMMGRKVTLNNFMDSDVITRLFESPSVTYNPVSHIIPSTVIDMNGLMHDVQFRFMKVNDHHWHVEGHHKRHESFGPSLFGQGDLMFDFAGNLMNFMGDLQNANMNWPNGMIQTVMISFQGIRETNAFATTVDKDGITSLNAPTYSITDTGTFQSDFNNGPKQNLFKAAIAKFPDEGFYNANQEIYERNNPMLMPLPMTVSTAEAADVTITKS